MATTEPEQTQPGQNQAQQTRPERTPPQKQSQQRRRFLGQQEAMPRTWQAPILDRPPFTGFAPPQSDADKVKLLEGQVLALATELNKVNWSHACLENELEAAERRIGLLEEMQKNDVCDLQTNAAEPKTAEEASLRIATALTDHKVSTLKGMRELREDIAVLIPRDYKYSYDIVQQGVQQAINLTARTGNLSSGALENELREAYLVLARDHGLQRILKHIDTLETDITGMGRVSIEDMLAKLSQETIKSHHDAVMQQLSGPMQMYADERAVVKGYDRGFFEGLTFSRAKYHNQTARDAAFFRAFTEAERSLTQELLTVPGTWTAFAKTCYTRGYHEATSFHARSEADVLTREHRKHHLKQAAAYSVIANREDETNPNLLDPDSLSYVHNPGETDNLGYFSRVRKEGMRNEEKDRTAEDPRVALSKIPLKYLEQRDQAVIRKGQNGDYESAALGNLAFSKGRAQPNRRAQASSSRTQ